MNTVPNSDGELLAGYAREGSEPAFRALVARHVHLVFGSALRQTGNRPLAEEITQNVFIALARKAPSLSRHETIAGWLHRTTLLECKARIRAELRRQRREDVAAALAENEATQGAPADQDPALQLLDEGLMGLADGDRSAVLLRFLEGRTFAEVGRSLGVSEDAARKRVDRAIERLAGFFRGRGFSSASTASALVPMLFSQGAPAVPAQLSFSAASAGLAAGSGGGTLASAVTWLMRMTPAQGLVAGAVLSLAPAGWSVSASRVDAALLLSERRALAAQQTDLAAARAELQARRQEIADRTPPGLGGFGAVAGGGGGFRAVADTAEAFVPWDDQFPLVRISKRFLASQRVYGLRDGHGHLSESLVEVLQLTPVEVAAVEAALDRFIEASHEADAAAMQVVDPEPKDLQGHSREDTRVFRIGDLHESVGGLRTQLYQEVTGLLGAERFEQFKQSLRAWMPIDDVNRGFGNSREIFTEARRERYYRMGGSRQQPNAPGEAVLGWSIALEKEGTGFQTTRRIDEIPVQLRGYLQDWMEEARRVNTTPLPQREERP